MDEPIAAEIFSVERLEHHAESLAKAQEVLPAPSAGISLRGRLRSNAYSLGAAFHTLAAGIRKGQAVTPAAEWLVDNYYIVDEHIRAVRRDLPAGYYKQLPKLSNGPLRGYPRVYGLAWAIIAHSDNCFEPDTLMRFCRAYQRVQPLTIGELWAIAITLRVLLIENLSRLAAGIVSRLLQRERADSLADEWLAEEPARVTPDIAVLRAFEGKTLPNAFGVQLFQRLRDRDPETMPPLAWLQQAFAARGSTVDDIVHGEHQRQGAVNVSVRNIITSLRLISSVDWAKFFESVSLVDGLLREHSSYGAFDFSTRDLYRHAIEDLSRRSKHTEMEVARCALAKAQQAAELGSPGAADPQPQHALEPGYYLVSTGRAELERELAYRIPWNQRLARWTRAAGISGYAGAIAVSCVAMTAAVMLAAGAPGRGGAAALVIALLALVAASDIGIAVVNLWVNHFCNASVLPGLELVDGVPTELRTVIAVPVLLTTEADIREHVRGLEVHYLAAQDGDIRFALLTDWVDSTAETTPQDAALLELAAAGVARLNRVHGGVHGDDRFLLLHRRRLWNRTQGLWMGWERKRGKLHEFNLLLRGSTDTSFVPVGGRPPQRPAGVRYVISLDADTRLPRGAALALIGKMAHPLNRPVIDASRRVVTAGYGILQPRVTPSLPVGREGSIFQRVFSGSSGIDPYAFAVSDVYQDLFGEGSYSGKGIYDIAAFETTLANRAGDDRMLSHDLFEGVHARCGLASDVEVVEEYPSRYDVATARQHRWTRGDWQLLPWVLSTNHPLAPLGRWKMFDNLRRSLLVPAVLLGFALCWTVSAPLAWSLFFLGSIVLPSLLPFLINLRSARREARQTASLISLRLIFWADQAWSLADAVLRTLYRLAISRRNLLEWTTAAQSKTHASSTVPDYYRRMSGGVLVVLSLTLFLLLRARGVPWIAAPLLLAWLCAPIVARAVSLPAGRARRETLTADDERRLRIMARQTWSFFDTFVTAQHNMLPPDNFQEIPHAVVANRTSPTNIGLYLLSVAAAREFGWIGTTDAVERLEATFSTLDKLERFRGHFYNWYDTRDLRPLDPKYISTVDSGNLAGHLLALEGVCRRWLVEPFPAHLDVSGILDTLEQLQDVARILEDGRRNYGVSPRQLDQAVDALRVSLKSIDSLDQASALATILLQVDSVCDFAQALTDERPKGGNLPLLHWSDMLRANVLSRLRDIQATPAAAPLAERLAALARRARSLSMDMQFGFLVDPARQLLCIGYRPVDRAQDPSCFDLLASEARLASFVAIAKGDLPVRHWFRLGRLLTPVDRGSALVSWTGSMFEYLMPVLVMREPEGSVLGDTSRLIVKRQIEYGGERRLPWGVSESAFNARDREFTYQYSSFGVPGLGLKRGLGEEAVVAPYATGLAMMIDPKAALRNFDRLQKLGARGLFGWYEALDFSPARLPEGVAMVPVRAFMAHHQGMVLAAIANVLKDGMFRKCFHSNSIIQATELLLQERTPRDSDRTAPSADEVQSAAVRELSAAVPRRFTSPHHAAPRTHLLSNGNYSVMLTAAGSGYSRWRDIAVTRWREDSTCDPWGCYVFLRDVANGEVWSAGYQPVGREPDSYEVTFFEDRAQITRRDGPILTSTEILVSSEDDAEVRRVSLTNEGTRVSEIELTTYAEVVLATADSDSAHPAFSKMFVQTEFVAASGALLATRRTRDPADPSHWVAHVSVLEGEGIGGLQFETDRARFLGRGHDLRNAVSIVDAHPLSNTTGTVLDPVLALRRRVRIAPGDTAHIAFWTCVAAGREQALALVDKHRDMAAFERAKTLAWTQAQVQLRYLGIDFDEAQAFQRIANRVLYCDSSLRASRDILEKNQLGQSALWPHGISGDLPLVLVRIDDENDLEIVKQLLRAHEYWRFKRLAVDLVILNERPPSYASELQLHLDAAIRTSQTRRDEDGTLRGAVFSLRADLLPSAICDLLQTAARALFVARRGTLSDQLARLREPEPVPRRRLQNTVDPPRDAAARAMPPLEFFNGLGGFDAEAREYVVVLDEGQWTPAPWVNVIANAQFGFLASAEGSGSTWSMNAQQNPLTPWSNDPVSNAPAEALYIRDEGGGDLWSATPLPIRVPFHTYVIRHGFGYSRYEHSSHGIGLELLQFVPLEDSLKISRLKIVNLSDETRQLSVTHYLDWVLGNQRAKTAPFIVTQLEPKTGALLARSPWSNGFPSRVAFMDMDGRQQAYTADRAEFIGRHGSLAEPAALLGSAGLQNRAGGGLDPCGAMQTTITLRPGEAAELKFLLGQEASAAAAVDLIERYRSADLDAVLRRVTDFWDETLGAVQVKTPDRSMDILLNGWLLYQTLGCRVWARSGFYQSSGAYGFRDQLQDVMALVVARPQIAREHILRAAARQFEEGDVQHWWLPSSGQGVRTRISDNRIWLPFVAAHYLEVTEDFALLDEQLPFLTGAPLAEGQLESFSAPESTSTTADLFEHCVRALNVSLAIGSHGLPLFGTGDWNDGMNRVGVAGRGESVWLGWFLHAALLRFAPIAERRGAADTAAVWRKHAFALQQAIEREAWDGDWYRRGYFDDGTPLGSVLSDECRIDAIAQSWGVISGAADPERAARAMTAVNAQLVSRSDGLVKLFTPAFDHTLHDPGYIKAYPPGLRENGGQYTHAAMWSVLAFALMGDGDRAAELFSIINPINHASTRAGIHRYKVEPYVVCADVYSAAQHIGRGGWTWYTGSAAWMYRTAMEGLLGIHLRGRTLTISPCVPRAWSAFEITYKFGASRYRIAVENPNGVNRGVVRASLDGREISGSPCEIALVDDGSYHYGLVTLG